MADTEKNELGLERLIFFSDAVVAIAITLLALDLKLNIPPDHHTTFRDIIQPWHTYLAFILSFINVAGFWQTHHIIFSYTRKMDRKMRFLNMVWLFFIVIIPFTTSLISSHITDTPPVFLYCINIFLTSLFQKFIWDYGDDDIPDNEDEKRTKRIDVMFTLELGNGFIAMIVSFFSPLAAFILLFFKIPLFILASFYNVAERRKEKSTTRK